MKWILTRDRGVLINLDRCTRILCGKERHSRSGRSSRPGDFSIHFEIEGESTYGSIYYESEEERNKVFEGIHRFIVRLPTSTVLQDPGGVLIV